MSTYTAYSRMMQLVLHYWTSSARVLVAEDTKLRPHPNHCLSLLLHLSALWEMCYNGINTQKLEKFNLVFKCRDYMWASWDFNDKLPDFKQVFPAEDKAVGDKDPQATLSRGSRSGLPGEKKPVYSTDVHRLQQHSGISSSFGAWDPRPGYPGGKVRSVCILQTHVQEQHL